MNLKGLSYRLDTEALRAFRINLQIDTDFYPERLKYLYMINAPCELLLLSCTARCNSSCGTKICENCGVCYILRWWRLILFFNVLVLY